MVKSKIEKQVIIDELSNHLKNLNCAMHAIQHHFFKTQIKELQTQIAYNFKVQKLYEDRFDDGQLDLILDKFVSVVNLSNAYDNCDESAFLTKMIPGSIIVSAVSTLDYYIFQALHTMLICDPNLSNSIDMNFQYKDVQFLDKTEDIREFCFSNYIEALFLGSHDDLFNVLERKFNLKSIKKLQGYKDFLLVTELRNIIVHHDGKKSLKFNTNIAKYKIKLSSYDLFDERGYITLMPENISWAIETCVSIATQLYMVICEHYIGKSEKLLEYYTYKINNIGVKYIADGESNIGLQVYDKLIGRKKKLKDYHMFCINKALCLKKLKRNTEMEEFLSNVDWTDCEEQFVLAKYILLEDYDLAVQYMDKVELDVWDCGYQDWPLCTSFVKSEQFKDKYQSIYGHPYEKRINKGRLSEDEVLKIYEERYKEREDELVLV